MNINLLKSAYFIVKVRKSIVHFGTMDFFSYI